MKASIKDYVNGRSIVMWGTGIDAGKAFRNCSFLGIEIDFFVAKNYKDTPSFFGKPVKKKTSLNKDNHYVIVATTAFYEEIAEELSDMGYDFEVDFYIWDDLKVGKKVDLHVIQGSYDYICSLGANCTTAQQMIYNGLRNVSGPFDWFITLDLARITAGLEQKFEKYMLPENMVLHSDQPSSTFGRYTDRISGFRSVHDVRFTDPVGDLLDLKEKFSNRVSRFFQTIMDSKKVLFIRRMQPNDNLSELHEKVTKLFGNHCTVLGVKGVERREEFQLYELEEGTYVLHMYDRSESGLNKLHWLGNTGNWQKLLSLFSLPSPAAKLETKLKLVSPNWGVRQVLIWGIGKYFPLIECILNTWGISDFLIYEPNLQKQAHFLEGSGFPEERIIGDLTDQSFGVENYYVIIDANSYESDIITFLQGKGFVETRDYLYHFPPHRQK